MDSVASPTDQPGGSAVPPAAAGSRIGWADLPETVRTWVSDALGAPVIEARTQLGGFSPGVAARLRCADGTRAFVKAVGTTLNPDSPKLHRAEAHVRSLSRVRWVPMLLDGYDDGSWVALLLEDVEGRHPALPWRRDELD